MEPVFRHPAVVEKVSSSSEREVETGFCLVTGKKTAIASLHSAIKGVRGANSTGANIVSFNEPAFCSYGKEKGANSPVGETAVFAYTTALNTLLGKDSTQRLQVGDATVVFWSERPSALEADLALLFDKPPKDNPNAQTDKVKALLAAPNAGAYAEDGDGNLFYVLGLSPYNARLAIRFWIVDSVDGMAGNIRRHFEDIGIIHGAKDSSVLSLWRLLLQTAAQDKSENIPPNLAGETMRAILEGTPYPRTLLGALIRRLKAGGEWRKWYPRAAFIKACVNRITRADAHNQEKEMRMSLDQENVNIGYRLGRLFAALEKTQQDALPGINATIRDRFYAAASSTPAAVFPSLLRTGNHHLSKLSDGAEISRNKLIGEIMSGIQDLPATLALEDQGRFAIGYYHQMRDFFTGKSDTLGRAEKSVF